MSAPEIRSVSSVIASGGRDDGFGLGLAIVREAVRAVGGTIQVDARPGGGTVVSVVLTGAEVPVA